MGRPSVLLAAAAGLLTASVHAATPQCGNGQLCPDYAPCCSQYGQCGVGAYCLGGCDIRYSHTIDSCVTAPTCKSDDYVFKSLDGIQAIDSYLGDADEANWQVQGRPVIYQNEALLLTMAPNTVGTLMASTHYVWYGRISATMTTSRGQGVVSAFIMMSDVQDEIDFEFTGDDIEHAQSNYFHQGNLDYHNMKKLEVGNTFEEVHTYTIDWKPDSLTWEVDGEPMRTLYRDDTFNDTSNQYDYPQTPARIMLSLWPAGLPKNGKGTIEWAGGLIDWDSPYMTNGYYSSMFKEVQVECYDPPDDADISGNKAYQYKDTAGYEGDVEITNNKEVLGSMEASGEDLNKGKPSKGDGPKSSSTSKNEPTAESVPGQSGGGARSGSSSSSSDESGGTSSGSGGSTEPDEPLSTGQSVPGGFNQGVHTTGDSAGTALVPESRFVGGSVFAVVVAIMALTVL